MPRDNSTRSRLAQAHRSALFDMLGRQCVECGATSQLEINHIYKREWVPRKIGSYHRQLRYKQEAAMGLLDVRCKACNHDYRPLPLARALEAASAANPF